MPLYWHVHFHLAELPHRILKLPFGYATRGVSCSKNVSSPTLKERAEVKLVLFDCGGSQRLFNFLAHSGRP
jgi:ribonuclease BN (tRNA processing enzyme)